MVKNFIKVDSKNEWVLMIYEDLIFQIRNSKETVQQ